MVGTRMAWRASGQSQKAFCVGKGYTRFSLSDWSCKFARKAIASGAPGKVVLTEVVRSREGVKAESFAILVERGPLRVTVDSRSGHLGEVLRTLASLP